MGASASWLGTVVLAAAVVEGSPVAVRGGPAGLLVADRVAVAVLLLVFGVSAVVQGFAGRYLRGDRRLGWFCGWSGVLTSATAVMVTSSTLLALAVGWTVAGVALVALLGMYRQRADARLGVWRTAVAFAVGDAALWGAVVLAGVSWGGLQLHTSASSGLPAPVSDQGVVVPAVALLVVVAVAARCGLVPFVRWLPATLAAPTPVSALLHAGVVNAGAVLLWRTSPLIGGSPVAMYAVFTVGAATMVYGTALAGVKVDVKGALVASTTAQMGFMIMTCGLGLYALALFHMIGHGLYKATLFLGSGSAVQRQRRHHLAPPTPAPTRGRAVVGFALAVVVPALTLAAGWGWLHSGDGARTEPAASTVGLGLLVFAWATAARLSWGWTRRTCSWPALAAGALGTAVAAPVYLLAVTGFTRFVSADQPPSTVLAAASPWGVAVLGVALLGLAALRSQTGPGWLGKIRARAYVAALSAADVTARQPGRRRSAMVHHPSVAPVPHPATEVGR
ncbi:MAG: hypothetical protein LH461_02730 [Spirochaetaceae bacterium]|nr:hypothetical protein [Spirochaetaceae bacterium]